MKVREEMGVVLYREREGIGEYNKIEGAWGTCSQRGI